MALTKNLLSNMRRHDADRLSPSGLVFIGAPCRWPIGTIDDSPTLAMPQCGVDPGEDTWAQPHAVSSMRKRTFRSVEKLGRSRTG